MRLAVLAVALFVVGVVLSTFIRALGALLIVVAVGILLWLGWNASSGT